MKTLLSLTLMFAGLASVHSLHAQDKAVPAAKTETWTDESFHGILDDLGYEPKTINLKGGGKRYRIDLNRDGWNFSFIAQMSTDHTVLWLSTRLCKLPEPADLKAEILEKLLKLNFELSPMHFLVRHDRSLTLDVPVDVHGMTAQELREIVDRFVTKVRTTHGTWKQLTPPAGSAASASTK